MIKGQWVESLSTMRSGQGLQCVSTPQRSQAWDTAEFFLRTSNAANGSECNPLYNNVTPVRSQQSFLLCYCFVVVVLFCLFLVSLCSLVGLELGMLLSLLL